MSSRSVRGSRCVDIDSLRRCLLAEIGILARGPVHEINLPGQKLGQRAAKPEELPEAVHPNRLAELDQEVEVATLGIEISRSRRAEQAQAAHRVAPAEISEGGAMRFEQVERSHAVHSDASVRAGVEPTSGLLSTPALS